MQTGKALKFSLKFILVSLLLVAVAVVFNYVFAHFNNYSDTTVSMNTIDPEPQKIIIDAGHGGEDGGAVGVNNVLEKDLNLEVSLLLSDLLTAAGYDVIMTRTEDRMLYSENVKGKLKTQDLKNRLAISEQNPDSIFISIHMNMFTQSHYSGLQVYYSPNNTESELLANIVQLYVKEYLQPENNRQTKKSGSSIYLMKKITTPAILIECGFLSNYEEAELLADNTYRHLLACIIYYAVDNYIINM